MGPVFRRVVADGHLGAARLHEALERQRVAGGFSEQELVATGVLSRTTFFALLAEHWNLPTRDLGQEPPDPSVLADVDLELVAERGWMPCEIDDDGELVVATSVRPGEDVIDSVEDHFLGRRVRFVACTERDLDQAVLAALSRRGWHGPRMTRRRAWWSTPGTGRPPSRRPPIPAPCWPVWRCCGGWTTRRHPWTGSC